MTTAVLPEKAERSTASSELRLLRDSFESGRTRPLDHRQKQDNRFDVLLDRMREVVSRWDQLAQRMDRVIKQLEQRTGA